MNAYKQFGYYYDETMANINYDLWVEFVEPFLFEGAKILDLACGTGTFLTMLKLKGYEVEGLDLSESIVEIANEKKKINRLDFPIYVADMVNFKLHKKFDIITCFFDSINFLSTKQDVKKMVDNVASHLNEGGYFICDIFSKEMMKEYENNELDEDNETYQIHWLTKKTSPTTLKHTITIKADGDEFNENYYEYYYDIKDFASKHFKLIKICGDFNDDLQEEDERILLVFQKL